MRGETTPYDKMSDSKAKADLQALLSLTQQTSSQSKQRLALFAVLVLGIIGVIAYGTVYVVRKMNAAQAEKEAASQLQEAERTANSSMVCPNGQKAVTCNGAVMCGPVCLPSQQLSCSGGTGAYTAVCTCKPGFTKVDGCAGCVPASCTGGMGVCPAEGVCECSAPLTSCKNPPVIDPNTGEISGFIPSPTCPQKCISIYEATQPSNFNATGRAGSIAKANELCREATCQYDEARPFETYPECSAPNSKFDGYDATLGKCFKTVNCSTRIDQGWTATVGPNTVSNLGVIYKVQGENNTCRSLTTNEMKSICLNDANGCPYGSEYVPATGPTGTNDYVAEHCRTAVGTTGVGPKGRRPTGDRKDWDGNTCWNGRPSFLLYSNITELQSMFTQSIVDPTDMQGRTVIKGYVAIPNSLLTINASNWMLQFEARECVPGNNGEIKMNGHKAGCDLIATPITPTTQSSITGLSNPSDYQIYEVYGIINNFLRSTEPNWPGTSDIISAVPYRCYFGFLVQTSSSGSSWQLVSMSRETDPATDCMREASNSVINTCGISFSVSMSKTGVQSFIPAPGLTRVGVTELLSANSINMLQSSMNNPYTPEVTSLQANPNQAMFAGNFQTPYVIASCSPDYCPANKLANTQVLVLGVSLKPLASGGVGFKPPNDCKAAFVIRRYQLDPAAPAKPWATFVGNSVQIASVMIGSTNSSGVFSKASGMITATPDPANPNNTTFVLADYVSANQTYVYQIAAYWWTPTDFNTDPDPTDPARSPDVRYAAAIKKGQATLFRYQIVRAPPYTKESCWAMSFTGGGKLPDHYIYDPVKSYCVPPNLFTPGTNNNPLNSDASYDYFYNLANGSSFDSINKGAVKLYDADSAQTVRYVPVNPVSFSTSTDVTLNSATGPDRTWQQDSTSWINPLGGSVTLTCPRKITLSSGTELVISSDWRTSQEAANSPTGARQEAGTLYGRLQDMDRFGRQFVPNYRGPSNSALLNYVDALKPEADNSCPWIDLRQPRSDDTIAANVQNIAMKGYSSSNPKATALNTQLVNNLRASNKTQFAGTQYASAEAMSRNPNWVDQFGPISIGADGIKTSAAYKFVKPVVEATGAFSSVQLENMTIQGNSLLMRGSMTQLPCNQRPYRISDIGTSTMKACCDCSASFTNPRATTCPT